MNLKQVSIHTVDDSDWNCSNIHRITKNVTTVCDIIWYGQSIFFGGGGGDLN